MGVILHAERANGCDRALWALIDAWRNELPFAVIVLSGCRTEAQQAAEWVKGRTLIDGKWVVTSAKDVATKAQHASQSAHGHGAAIDAMPLDDSGKLVWDTPETMHRVGMMAEVAERLGVQWGGRWPGFPDYDHFQLPGWQGMAVVG